MTAHAEHAPHASGGSSLNRLAALATLHCLTGCAIGEVLGLVIGTALGFSDAATIALAVFLAFVFGYSLTMVPLVRAGLTLAVALPLAFASDSFSIAVMELVDNGVMLAVPGAMDAPLSNPLFWGALGFALAVAYVVAFPVNRYLLARGQGHAVVHQYHGHHSRHAGDGADGRDDHHAHGGDDADGAHGATASRAAPSRRFILVGIVAMAATIGVATAGAVFVESRDHADDEPVAGRADGESAGHGESPGSAEPAELSGLAVAGDGYRLEARDTELSAGRPTQFAFTVVGEDGPVRRFDEEGGVRMHLIVVRRDLAGYQHLHPKLHADGSWRTELTLPSAGVYRAYADFERDGDKTVLGTDLFVAGDFAPARPRVAGNVVGAGDYRVELDGTPRAGAEATLTYRITRGGRPVDVERYLGAAGHLVALREGDLAYLHVHPLAERRGEVRFAATFPTAGRYRLFLQFKDAGRVQTAPMSVNVLERR